MVEFAIVAPIAVAMILLLFLTARLAGLGTRERMTLTGGDARLEG